MSEEQLKNMYDRTNKLLNGENKNTYGFSPAEIQQLIKEIQLLKSQLQQKENIIKEVREKLLCYGETFDSKIHQEMQKEFLEILDKEKE